MKRMRMTKANLEPLARLQCTMMEFCAAFQVNHTTLTSRLDELYDMSFTEFMELYGAAGHTSLRRAMWTKALKGDTKMQIFLAQNHLGMSEKTDNRHEFTKPKLTTIEDDINVKNEPKKQKTTKTKQKKPAAKKPMRPRKPKNKVK